MSEYYLPRPPIDPAKRQRERLIGQKIKKAFFITILFLLFLNSFTAIDKIYYLVTQKQYEFITEENQEPTIKGYIAASVLVFIITLWIIWN